MIQGSKREKLPLLKNSSVLAKRDKSKRWDINKRVSIIKDFINAKLEALSIALVWVEEFASEHNVLTVLEAWIR